MYEGEKTYYLVNKSGTIHNLPETLARERLQLAGWRVATKEEIAELFRRKGIQNTKSRICKKWLAEPPKVQELPDHPKPKLPKGNKK